MAPVLTKLFASAFFGTPLQSMLAAHGCDVVIAQVQLPYGAVRNGDEAKAAAAIVQECFERMFARLDTVPGISSVAVTSESIQGVGLAESGTTIIARADYGTTNRYKGATTGYVSREYFETMGIPLLTGRAFTKADNLAAPRVAIINEAAVRRFFPNESPVGRRFGRTLETSSEIEVVGVVGDAKYIRVRDDAK